MKDHYITAVVSILMAIVGVAIIALLVSRGANTSNVLGGIGQGIARAICVATSPVTGRNCASLTENVTSTLNFPTG